MKKILMTSFIMIFCSTSSYADYSNNPHCRGYGIVQNAEKQKCLEANKSLVKKEKRIKIQDGKIAVDTKDIKEKIFKKFGSIGLNTDSKLLKTGKYAK